MAIWIFLKGATAMHPMQEPTYSLCIRSVATVQISQHIPDLLVGNAVAGACSLGSELLHDCELAFEPRHDMHGVKSAAFLPLQPVWIAKSHQPIVDNVGYHCKKGFILLWPFLRQCTNLQSTKKEINMSVIEIEKLRTNMLSRLTGAGLDLIPLRGKIPRDKNWPNKPYTLVELENHLASGGNLGVRLTNRQLVLDIDPRNGGTESLERLRKDIGHPLQPWPFVRTGGGGAHHYLTKPAEMRLHGALPKYRGVEFKSFGFQVVAPGSIHPDSGKPYILDDPLEEIGSPPEAPEELLNIIKRKAPSYDRTDAEATLSPDELASVLSLIAPEAYRRGRASYEEWLEFSMACHAVTEGTGEPEWLDWCTSDPEYADARPLLSAKWSGFDAKKPDGVGLGTFRKHVENSTAAGERLRYVLASKDFEAFAEDEAGRWSEMGSENPVTKIVRAMNKKFCAALEGGRFVIFREDIDEAWNPPRQVLTRLSREDFRHFHENERVRLPDSGKEASVASVWLRHPEQRKYSGIVMDPQMKAECGRLNLWRGWAVSPKAGDWSLTQSLIDDVLCSGDIASAEYVRRWIAFMLQKPWQTPETAIAFRGKEGTGKSTLGRILMSITGGHGITVASSTQLAGRFNAHLRDAIFLFADEAFWPGNKEAEGALKQLVTEPIISFEAKGRDIVSGRNLIHLMLASNEQWIVPAGLDARRFAVFDVSDKRKGDFEFFDRLNAELNGGGLEAMVHDLMALELGDWHPSRNLPKTRALADQKLKTLSAVMKWWFQLLERGELPFLKELNSEWRNGAVTLGEVERQELTDDYGRFLKENRVFSEKASHRALIDSGSEFGLVKTKINRGAERAWKLPPLPEMRSLFEKRVDANGLFDS